MFMFSYLVFQEDGTGGHEMDVDDETDEDEHDDGMEGWLSLLL